MTSNQDSVGGRPRGLVSDTADTILSDLDVSLITPGWAPRVLDEEVVLAILSTITDSEDTVVKLGTAGGASNDTTGVALEGHLVGLNGDGDWALSNGSLQLGGRLGGNIRERFNGDNTLGFGIRALLVPWEKGSSGNVFVVRLKHDRVGLGISESRVHETTIAALILLGIAVNELLLREGNEFASSDEMGTLEGSSGGERPAGSALALVLNRGDSALGNPVDLIGEVGLIEDGDVPLLLHLRLETSELLSLISGPVSELIDTNGPGVVTSVVGLNLLEVGGEEGKSFSVFSSGTEVSVVLSDEREELLLMRVDGLIVVKHVSEVS